jgi:hypothetical protein
MGTQDKDLAVLRRLKELGSDLGKPHTVDFFLYFPSEEQASSAASEIEKEDYEVRVDCVPPPWWRRLFSKPVWGCYATKSIVPEEDTIVEISAWFEGIAQRFYGEYDGWGTEVTNNS